MVLKSGNVKIVILINSDDTHNEAFNNGKNDNENNRNSNNNDDKKKNSNNNDLKDGSNDRLENKGILT